MRWLSAGIPCAGSRVSGWQYAHGADGTAAPTPDNSWSRAAGGTAFSELQLLFPVTAAASESGQRWFRHP